MPGHVLIAEDEPRMASFMETGLRRHGFTTTVVDDGEAALEHARTGLVDLVILDLGLPTLDGWGVLRSLRGEGNEVPILILTARSSVANRVAGLEGGASDYLTKPFAFEELLARVRLRLRDDRARDRMSLRVGDLHLDLGARTLSTPERTVELSSREFALAEMFFRHPGEALSRERILSEVWEYDFDPDTNIVNVYVAYLRRKMGAEWIETVRGVGYRLATRRAPAPGGETR